MTYSVKCTHPQGVRVNSLNINLSEGQSFDCPKTTYDTNKEVQFLVSSGMLTLTVKENKGKLRVNSGKRALRTKPSERVVERVVERVIESPVDMDSLTKSLVDRIGNILSPEVLAQAIAAQMPTISVNSSQVSNASPMSQSPEDDLMFIPSTIVNKNTVASKSSASEVVSEDNDIASAMEALKALRKGKK